MIIQIRNGWLMDPISGKEGNGSILLEGDAIRAVRWESDVPEQTPMDPVCEELWKRKPARVIDAAGCVIAPGLMDVHVHFRDPGFTWKEDLYTGSAAAARGGFTTVVCMANTRPVVDHPLVLEDILQRAAGCPVRVLQASSVTKGLKGAALVDMEVMAQKGAVCFTDDGIPIMDEAVLLEAMKRAKALGLPISLHEEDPLLIHGAGVHPGEAAKRLGYGGAAPQAEEILTARDCILALYTGACVNIQHISSARSVAIVRQARQWGANVHAEATPHHFTLTEQAVLQYGTNARMNPPLRTEEDRQAIIEGLADGTIEMIVTDHAPHAKEEKAKPLSQAPSGIIGLETSLGLGLRELVQTGRLSLMQLLQRMSSGPAGVYGLEPGRLKAGYKADLVVFAPQEEWIVDHFVSKSTNSPFLGWKLPGKIHFTICRGEVVYDSDVISQRTRTG